MGSGLNLFAVVWLALAAAAALATFALVQVGLLSARRLAVPAALIVVAIVAALASSAVSALLAIPYIALPLACSATALAAATGRRQRAVALACILLVVVGGEVYLAGGFGGLVLLACGYAAGTAFVVLTAAIAVVRHARLLRRAV